MHVVGQQLVISRVYLDNLAPVRVAVLQFSVASLPPNVICVNDNP